MGTGSDPEAWRKVRAAVETLPDRKTRQCHDGTVISPASMRAREHWLGIRVGHREWCWSNRVRVCIDSSKVYGSRAHC